jgi:hypothetical protein
MTLAKFSSDMRTATLRRSPRTHFQRLLGEWLTVERTLVIAALITAAFAKTAVAFARVPIPVIPIEWTFCGPALWDGFAKWYEREGRLGAGWPPEWRSYVLLVPAALLLSFLFGLANGMRNSDPRTATT